MPRSPCRTPKRIWTREWRKKLRGCGGLKKTIFRCAYECVNEELEQTPESDHGPVLADIENNNLLIN